MSAQAGIYYPDRRPISQEMLQALCEYNETLGPDRTGVYVTDGLAMLSFALHFDELARDERQPITTPDGAVLTWDGRLDNRGDFAVRLQSELAGDSTDAHLMALAVSRWGDGALRDAVGDWSLVRWNARTRELLLACDYLGELPLHYSVGHDYFVWSTSAKTIARLCKLSTPDDGFLANWLISQAPPGRTATRGLWLLSAGHAMRVSSDLTISSQITATLRNGTIRYRDRTQYEEHYRHVLVDAVRARLRACRPVWIELSGGYDSSSLTCIAHGLLRGAAAQAPALQPVSTFMENDLEEDERMYIASVEAFCGLKSNIGPYCRELPIEPDAYEVPPFSAAAYMPSTEQAVHASGSHVLITGQFGDAITAHVSFKLMVAARLASLGLPALFRDGLVYCRARRQNAVATAWQLLQHVPRSMVRRTLDTAVSTMARQRGLARADVAATHCLEPAFVRRAFVEEPWPRSPLARCLHWIAHIRRSLSPDAIPTPTWGVRSDLVVRPTHPFTARPVVEFINATPPEVLWSPAHPRAFHLTAFRGALPKAIVERGHKRSSSSSLHRNYSTILEHAITELDHWLLVTGGYADKRELSTLFRQFLGRAATAPISLVGALLVAESLLQQVTRGPLSCAAEKHMPSSVSQKVRPAHISAVMHRTNLTPTYACERR